MGSNAVRQVTVAVSGQSVHRPVPAWSQTGKQISISQTTPERIVYRVSDADVYDGAYTVIPKFQDQVLQTADKLLEQNVTVKEITVSRVSNESGGKTVWIGEI